MKKDIYDNKKVIAFVVLEISYFLFIVSVLYDWQSWSNGWGFFFLGLLTFIYSWFIYFYKFK